MITSPGLLHRPPAGGRDEAEIRRLLLRLLRLVAAEVAKSLAGDETGSEAPSGGVAPPVADTPVDPMRVLGADLGGESDRGRVRPPT